MDVINNRYFLVSKGPDITTTHIRNTHLYQKNHPLCGQYNRFRKLSLAYYQNHSSARGWKKFFLDDPFLACQSTLAKVNGILWKRSWDRALKKKRGEIQHEGETALGSLDWTEVELGMSRRWHQQRCVWWERHSLWRQTAWWEAYSIMSLDHNKEIHHAHNAKN